MGLSDLIDDDSDDEQEDSSAFGSPERDENQKSLDKSDYNEYDDVESMSDMWDGPTHSEPEQGRQWTCGDKSRRIYDNTFLIEYDDDGTYRGPSPPSVNDDEELPSLDGEGWHPKWVNWTDEWHPKLVFEKQAECPCGNNVWMKRRAAWLRCPHCSRVLVDLDWDKWTKDHRLCVSGSPKTPMDGYDRTDTYNDDGIWKDEKTTQGGPSPAAGSGQHNSGSTSESSSDSGGKFERLTDFN